MVKVVKKGSGRRATGPNGTDVEILVQDADNLSFGKITFNPGQKTENHTREVDETLYILSGQTRVVVADKETYDLEEGDCIYLPAGITHRHENNSESKFTQIWIFAPAGPEKTFLPAGRQVTPR